MAAAARRAGAARRRDRGVRRRRPAQLRDASSSGCTSPTPAGRPSSRPRRRSRSWCSTCCGTTARHCSTSRTCDRRDELRALALDGPNWQTPASVHGADDGAAMLAASEQLGLEGIVAKRSTSRYELGKRSRQWLKVKHRRQQELVVGGWVEGQGSRRASIGALLVGYYDDDGALHFAGRVGSGFRDRDLAMWTQLLADRARRRRHRSSTARSRVTRTSSARSSSSRSRSPSGPATAGCATR